MVTGDAGDRWRSLAGLGCWDGWTWAKPLLACYLSAMERDRSGSRAGDLFNKENE